jgi:hypothetical protein
MRSIGAAAGAADGAVPADVLSRFDHEERRDAQIVALKRALHSATEELALYRRMFGGGGGESGPL